MDGSEYIGIAAGTLTTISYIPQISKLFRENDNDGLSPTFFIILLIGGILWTIYGFKQNVLALKIFSVISACFLITILTKYYQIEYKKNKERYKLKCSR